MDEKLRSREERDEAKIERVDRPTFVRARHRLFLLRHANRGTRLDIRRFQLPFRLAMSITKRYRTSLLSIRSYASLIFWIGIISTSDTIFFDAQ